MKKTIVEQMVDRFLSWKLPEDFAPDDGIRFIRNEYHDRHGMPSGTNLLHAGQAKAMIEHLLAGIEAPENYSEAEGDAYTHGFFDGMDEANKAT